MSDGTIHRADVEAAARRVAGHVRRTPLLATDPGHHEGDWFKLEHLQHTGSWKARGAFNQQLAAHRAGRLDPSAGVVVASGGNAGLAHAHAARRSAYW